MGNVTSSSEPDKENQMGLFDGKVVWLTSAGTGIGRAGALMFAEEGATVALMGRCPEPLESVAKVVGDCPGKAIVEPLDAGDRGADRALRYLPHRRGAESGAQGAENFGEPTSGLE